MPFRTDIHGLRGLAILLVVAYHVRLEGFSGGFVGVDVFFVLSGYLITGLLYREWARTGTISLWEFYARRARRLLPAAAVVLTATTATALLVLSPPEQLRIATSAIATALYVSNLFFVRVSTDYLAAPPEENPYLHTWSLSVEEQFYVVWPTLILLVLRVCKARGASAAAVAVVGLCSFAACVWLTAVAQPWAFFGSPARVWEFAAGACVALMPIASARLSSLSVEAGTALGLAMIAVAATAFDRNTDFPGFAALLPVTGTTLILALATESRTVGAILRTRPLQWFGDVSYVWYLWHWPALVFANALAPELGTTGLVAAGLLSLGLSATTRGLLEDRVRFSPRLLPRSALTVGLAAAVTLVGATATSVWRVGAALASRTEQLAPFARARNDNPVLYANGCHLDFTDVSSPECSFGDPKSITTVVLFGDSHAAHWFPALERVAVEEQWHLVSLTKSGCPSVDVTVRGPGRRYTECDTWRRNSLGRIEALDPDLVVITNSSDYVEPSPLDQLGARTAEAARGVPRAIARTSVDWLAGLRRTLRSTAGLGLRTIILRDSPAPGFDVPTCLARHAWRPWLYQGLCGFSLQEALRPDIRLGEDQAASEYPLASIIEVSSAICPGGSCDASEGDIVVYRDSHHLTARFARTLAPSLAAKLKSML